MFENVEDLKQFIIWAKSERVKALEVGGVKIEFSELAFIDGLQDLSEAKSPTNENVAVTGVSMPESVGTDTQDDEEALYWSTKP